MMRTKAGVDVGVISEEADDEAMETRRADDNDDGSVIFSNGTRRWRWRRQAAANGNVEALLYRTGPCRIRRIIWKDCASLVYAALQWVVPGCARWKGGSAPSTGALAVHSPSAVCVRVRAIIRILGRGGWTRLRKRQAVSKVAAAAADGGRVTSVAPTMANNPTRRRILTTRIHWS